jgi:hypothetical protein
MQLPPFDLPVGFSGESRNAGCLGRFEGRCNSQEETRHEVFCSDSDSAFDRGSGAGPEYDRIADANQPFGRFDGPSHWTNNGRPG